jgi:hypothetical protein
VTLPRAGRLGEPLQHTLALRAGALAGAAHPSLLAPCLHTRKQRLAAALQPTREMLRMGGPGADIARPASARSVVTGGIFSLQKLHAASQP